MDIRHEIFSDRYSHTANILKNKLNSMASYEICEFIEDINKLQDLAFEMNGTGTQHYNLQYVSDKIKKVLP